LSLYNFIPAVSSAFLKAPHLRREGSCATIYKAGSIAERRAFL